LPGDGFGRDDVVAGYHPDKNTGALALVVRISDSLRTGSCMPKMPSIVMSMKIDSKTAIL
jgi:hypothetical protein